MTPEAKNGNGEKAANGGNGGSVGLLDPSVTATGDPVPPIANPLILNDAYYELNGVNLRCLVKHLEIIPENKLVTVTSFCAEVDWPGVTKWHQKVTFYQSFDTGAVYNTLNTVYQAYLTGGTPATFKTRPHSSLVASATNPIITGQVIPLPFDLMIGDAGAASELAIDWSCIAPPTVNTGAITATGANAGFPGVYTPSGATVPANLAGLSGVVANPATAWATGQYIITADLIGAHWTGTAWAVGKA
jgi:hypothetical protein